MSRPIAPVTSRVSDPTTDRILRNHDERIRDLVARVEQLTRLSASPFTMILQSLSAVTDQIQSGTTPFAVNEITAASSLTMTSTPTIVAGAADGQILVIRRSAAAGSTVTIQNESVLSGSGLRLDGAANKALTTRDCVVLVWRASASEWFQVAPVSVN